MCYSHREYRKEEEEARKRREEELRRQRHGRTRETRKRPVEREKVLTKA